MQASGPWPLSAIRCTERDLHESQSPDRRGGPISARRARRGSDVAVHRSGRQKERRTRSPNCHPGAPCRRRRAPAARQPAARCPARGRRNERSPTRTFRPCARGSWRRHPICPPRACFGPSAARAPRRGRFRSRVRKRGAAGRSPSGIPRGWRFRPRGRGRRRGSALRSRPALPRLLWRLLQGTPVTRETRSHDRPAFEDLRGLGVALVGE